MNENPHNSSVISVNTPSIAAPSDTGAGSQGAPSVAQTFAIPRLKISSYVRPMSRRKRPQGRRAVNFGALLQIAHTLVFRIPESIMSPVREQRIARSPDLREEDIHQLTLLLGRNGTADNESLAAFASCRPKLADVICIAAGPCMKYDPKPTHSEKARLLSPYVCTITGTRGLQAFQDALGLSRGYWSRFFKHRDRIFEPTNELLRVISQVLAANSRHYHNFNRRFLHAERELCARKTSHSRFHRLPRYFSHALGEKVVRALDINKLQNYLTKTWGSDGSLRNIITYLHTKKLRLQKGRKPQKARRMCDSRTYKLFEKHQALEKAKRAHMFNYGYSGPDFSLEDSTGAPISEKRREELLWLRYPDLMMAELEAHAKGLEPQIKMTGRRPNPVPDPGSTSSS